jgi:ABC-type lipoprotein export system ATPase subunit
VRTASVRLKSVKLIRASNEICALISTENKTVQRLVSIEGIRLYGHFYLKHQFSTGVNIVYGDNGGGKTTLLHILTNALMGNFRRFAYLEFASINMEFDDGAYLELYRNHPLDREEYIEVKLNDELIWTDTINHAVFENDEILKAETNFPSVAYFPAYRNLYDYLALSLKEQGEKLLSPFAPPIHFPSMGEIEDMLKGLVSSTEVPENIKTFIEIINGFYENKKLILNKEKAKNAFELIYADKHTSNSLSSLSSGERQITAIFYAISQLSSHRIVLIDEPEISLHVGWQRKILQTIDAMLNSEQIIACTHSPVIGADYELSELEFRFVGN